MCTPYMNSQNDGKHGARPTDDEHNILDTADETTDEERGHVDVLSQEVKKLSVNDPRVSVNRNAAFTDSSSENTVPQIQRPSVTDTTAIHDSKRLTKEERYILQVETDSRSIFVGNITSDATPEIIEEHFHTCGTPKRITLLYDKNTGVPKGYAYVEFEDQLSRERALVYNGSEMKGRTLNVYKKRTNLPAYQRSFPNYKSKFYSQQQWNLPYNGGFQQLQDIPYYHMPYQFSPYNQGSEARHRNRKVNYKGNRKANTYNKVDGNHNNGGNQEAVPLVQHTLSNRSENVEKQSEEIVSNH